MPSRISSSSSIMRIEYSFMFHLPLFTLPAGCDCCICMRPRPHLPSQTLCRSACRDCHSDITSIICHTFLSQLLTVPLRILKSPGAAVNARTRLRTRACPAIHTTQNTGSPGLCMIFSRPPSALCKMLQIRQEDDRFRVALLS